jgi:hypothetical protein
MAITRKQISITVDKHCVPHIMNCLRAFEYEDFTVAPVMSGWSQRGYWSSEHTFSKIGEKIMVRFITDVTPLPMKAMIANGFGIVARDIVMIQQTDAPAVAADHFPKRQVNRV